MVYQSEISCGHREMHDLTGEVARIVKDSGIRHGVANIFNVGSTGQLARIEFEPGLEREPAGNVGQTVFPSRDYGHEKAWHDGNGHSHLQATMLGPSLTVPIRERALVLGTWQQSFHLEGDIKPRQRRIVVTVTEKESLSRD